jgi:F-type H+-transporting ATPase subunit delta
MAIIAKRYGDAFIAYAKPDIGLETAVRELKDLKILISQNREFIDFLDNVQILYREKCDFIDRVLKGYSEQTRQFIKLLVTKERIKHLVMICDYVRTHYSHGEGEDALLKTANMLDLAMIKQIKARLEHKLNKKLNLHIELDPDLLGGLQLTVGNVIIDGSVQRNLADLKEKLKKIKVS